MGCHRESVDWGDAGETQIYPLLSSVLISPLAGEYHRDHLLPDHGPSQSVQSRAVATDLL